MTFATWVFRIAAAWGVLLLLPLYFLEEKLGRDFPPAITHPEFFYGFVGLALAWQVAFLVLATDPARYRPFMLLGVLEKLSYVGATATLFALGRAPAAILLGGGADLVLAALFLEAWRRTRPPTN